MNEFEIEKIYEKNGLEDCLLKSTDDLLKCHNIDFTSIPGYEFLDDLKKANYKNFIVNFFNVWGLEARASLKPTGIYFVENIEYVAADETGELIHAGEDLKYIKVDGSLHEYKSYRDEEFEGKELEVESSSRYLRFEYICQDTEGWVHVVENGTQWY